MELAALLEEAHSAPPDRRIEWRDRIAAHGASAIDGIRPWLADDVLAAFAVRVIERVGVNGEAELASQVLRSERAHVPAEVSADVTWALRKLVRKPKGTAPGLVSGVMQLNVVVPATSSTGNVPLVITCGGVSSQANVTLAVK